MKIVLFGATGFTGRNTASAMVDRGLKPVLAGRNREKLLEIAGRIGGLKIAEADINDPASVTRLVTRGDVLVSTVGPFTAYGKAALEAAVTAGAHYMDSTGEPGFIRKVFEEYGPRAKAAGVALITGCAFEYVAGNCAAGIALRAAGPDATRVDVGYYKTGLDALYISQGTMASIRFSILEPGRIWKSGTLAESYGAAGVRSFNLDGIERAGILLPSTESFSLPRIFSHVKDINVYLGWYGRKSYALNKFAVVNSALLRIPGYKSLLEKIIAVTSKSASQGPDENVRAATGSHIIAETYDAEGWMLARTELTGANAYDFTFKILSWAANMIAVGGLKDTGALGPVEAFGLAELINGCKQAGLEVK